MFATILIAAAQMCAQETDVCAPGQWNDNQKKIYNRATLITTIRCLISTDPTHRDMTQALDEALDEALGITKKRARKRRPGRWFPRIAKFSYSKWKERSHKVRV